MTKVDPALLLVIARHLRAAGPGAEATTEPRPVHVSVLCTGDVDDLRAAGFEPLGRLRTTPGGTLAAGRIALTDLGRLDAVPHVVAIQGSSPAQPQLNRSVPAIRADRVHNAATPVTGEGVVIGIIDTGIDWRHPDFTRPDGTSRIMAIWDQTLVVDPELAEHSPLGFPGMGVEYLADDIRDALAGTLEVRTGDDQDGAEGHGTFVAGIAAGDGSATELCGEPAGSYVGVAPDARLIVVVRSYVPEVGSAGSLENALDYIWHRAGAGTPVVVNYSSTTFFGPNDGTSLEEIAITADLEAQAGRAMVIGAGNARADRQHASVVLPINGPGQSLMFWVPPCTDRPVQVQAWYEAPAAVPFALVAPDEQLTTITLDPVDTREVVVDDGGTAVALYAGALPAGRCALSVTISPAEEGDDVLDGYWTLQLANASTTATAFLDARIYCSDPEAEVQFTSHVDEYRTLGAPATCEAAITVGAYVPGAAADGSDDELAWFTSFGPTRTGGRKPDVVAPGEGIMAPGAYGGWECCRGLCWDLHRPAGGTSAAAPHVAGVVALMFQVNPDLAFHEIKRILRDEANTEHLPEPHLYTWGAGRVDAEAAVRAVPPPGMEAPLHPVPPSPSPAPWGTPGPEPGPEVPAGAPRTPPPPVALALTGPAAGVDGVVGEVVGRIVELPGGEVWAALVSRHFSEVRALVNHHKRVALRWHRLQGPALVAHVAHRLGGAPRGVTLPALDLGRDPDRDRERLAAFLTALERHGSPALAAAVARHRATILAADPATLLRALGAGARAA